MNNFSNFNNIRLLDCTLRDGGNVNDWNFGSENIKNLIKKLDASKVDFIELGHFKKEVNNPDQSLSSKIEYFENLANKYIKNNDYCTVMTRPDKFDIRNISEYRDNSKIKGIRFAFYPYHLNLLIDQIKVCRDKGYDIFINPVGISCYKKDEIINILKKVKKFFPSYISIVDSFGALDSKKLIEIYKIFNEELEEDIGIGIHLHENMSLAFSMAKELIINRNIKRNLIIDASLQGMGRVPGNLCMELIMKKLNEEYRKDYNLIPVYEAIQEVISPIKKNLPWGYMPQYFLSACENVNRNYAEYFYEEAKIPLNKLTDAFKMVKKEEPSGLKYSEELSNKIAYQIKNQCL